MSGHRIQRQESTGTNAPRVVIFSGQAAPGVNDPVMKAIGKAGLHGEAGQPAEAESCWLSRRSLGLVARGSTAVKSKAGDTANPFPMNEPVLASKPRFPLYSGSVGDCKTCPSWNACGYNCERR